MSPPPAQTALPTADAGPADGAGPVGAGRAAATPPEPPSGWRRARLPYLLLAPTILVLAVVLGYPLVRVVILSFQHWGIDQIFGSGGPKFVGLENYATIFGDPEFWLVLRRTLLLTAAMVAITMLLGVGIALLMGKVPRVIARGITFVLIMAWAVPTFVSTQVFAWMTEQNFGVLNYLLGLGQHNWYVDATQGLAVATAIVVWGAVPFIAVTTRAGLSQVPPELLEAARLDGAGSFNLLRRITLPMIRPILVIQIALSVIWDFQVFNQIWVLRNAAPEKEYQTLGIYAYVRAYQGHEYGYASAVAVVTVLMLLAVLVFYLFRMVRSGEVR